MIKDSVFRIKFSYLLISGLILMLLSLGFVFLEPSAAGAATRADCNARAQVENCKREVDNKCAGKSGNEKDKCIETVLSDYVFTGLGAGGIKNCAPGASGNNCLGNLPKVDDSPNQVRNALSIVFGIAAGVALIALLIAAFNYVTAGTDIEKTGRSKRSIVTALAGLVIAVAAQVIVLTVLGQL